MTTQYPSYDRADSAGRASFEALDTFVQTNLLSGSEPPLSAAVGMPLANNADFPQFAVVGEVGNVPGAALAWATNAGAKAARTFGAGNAALTITAKADGVGGNDISVIILAAAADGKVDVDGHEITITPDTDTPTATAVAALVNGDEAASLLVTATAGGDGTGNVAAAAEQQLTGGLDKIQAIGVLAHAAALGATGSGNGNVWLTGCFNAGDDDTNAGSPVVWHASFDTVAKRVNAFRGAPTPTNILVRRRTAPAL